MDRLDEAVAAFKTVLAEERATHGRDYVRKKPQGLLLDALDAGRPDTAHDPAATGGKPPPRIVGGFEVVAGWTMPDPPREGLEPYVQFHGGDGRSLFWWDPTWGKWANEGAAYGRSRAEGFESYMDTEVLVSPDTGGAGYKACMEAYVELGFNEA